jgi:type II secretory pathway predicted ATPase ExeA
MYNDHFGLRRTPFRITPDTSLFYSGAERGSVLEALAYVILSGEGITKVIGEVGSGKTMLCRMLEEKFPERVDTIYIANPGISPENILNVLAFEAGLILEPKSKLEAMQALHRWLLERHAANHQVVVLIEEAQGMPLETLEEIRLLSNLETGQHKLLQIVLFGQPELDEKLGVNSIRQLRERITHNFYLSPLNRAQIKEYLNFRMRSAGYHGPDLFDNRMARLIGRYSAGLIRRINILADKILLAAYAAGTTRLGPRLARKAAADCQFGSASRRIFPHFWLSTSIGMTAGLCLASLIWWINQSNASTIGYSPGDGGTENGRVAIAAPSATRTEAGILAAVTGTKPDSPSGARLVEERLRVTRARLAQANGTQYSIQLMTLKGPAAETLNDYLVGLPKTVDLNDIFIYESTIDGEKALGVLYRIFANRAEADAKTKDMPEPLAAFEPFLLRSIEGLRNDIAGNHNG